MWIGMGWMSTVQGNLKWKMELEMLGKNGKVEDVRKSI